MGIACYGEWGNRSDERVSGKEEMKGRKLVQSAHKRRKLEARDDG